MKRSFLVVWCFLCVALFNVSFLQGETWTSPVDLSAAGQDASGAQVAMNASGQVVAVWARAGVIEATTVSLGGAWSAPVTLSSGSDVSGAPQVGINDVGQVVAVWKRQNGANYDIQVATLLFGGSWSAPVSLISLGSEVNVPQVAINTSGETVVVWTHSDGTNFLVESATMAYGGAWSAIDVLSASGADATVPLVALNDSGQGVAIWIRNDVVQASSSSFGGSWSGGVNLSTGAAVSLPSLSIDSGGNARAQWRRTSGANFIFEMGTLAFGGSWVSPIFLTQNQGCENHMCVCLAGNGETVVVWMGSDGTNIRINGVCYISGVWSAACQGYAVE